MSDSRVSASKEEASESTRRDALFLDANIVMYMAGAPHPLRRPCREAVRRVVDLHLPLVTDAEVLQEILHRYFAIGRSDDAASVYRSAVDLCEEVLPVREKDTARALDLLRSHRALDPRDAIHVATMEAAGLRRILSTDRDFDAVGTVDRIDPVAFARLGENAG